MKINQKLIKNQSKIDENQSNINKNQSIIDQNRAKIGYLSSVFVQKKNRRKRKLTFWVVQHAIIVGQTTKKALQNCCFLTYAICIEIDRKLMKINQKLIKIQQKLIKID